MGKKVSVYLTVVELEKLEKLLNVLKSASVSVVLKRALLELYDREFFEVEDVSGKENVEEKNDVRQLSESEVLLAKYKLKDREELEELGINL